ncbi:hypothetical protein F0562_020417 [Nyssa sinensis]|uniref:RING-type domain-containing protein n=1 Tax=Nyssa sinensis TaxID=561372 RepID=A0A5J5BR27_9ASTE|nr:hypothetical protein F0562_020417 [Nyssa sinensis]
MDGHADADPAVAASYHFQIYLLRPLVSYSEAILPNATASSPNAAAATPFLQISLSGGIYSYHIPSFLVLWNVLGRGWGDEWRGGAGRNLQGFFRGICSIWWWQLQVLPIFDCPSVYRVAEPETTGGPFACGACYVETCTGCHLEYHPYVSCERYKELKEDPDLSLNEWRQGKDNVKGCPVCGYIIEKVDGCDHIECRCGRQICRVCLESFSSNDD